VEKYTTVWATALHYDGYTICSWPAVGTTFELDAITKSHSTAQEKAWYLYHYSFIATGWPHGMTVDISTTVAHWCYAA